MSRISGPGRAHPRQNRATPERPALGRPWPRDEARGPSSRALHPYFPRLEFSENFAARDTMSRAQAAMEGPTAFLSRERSPDQVSDSMRSAGNACVPARDQDAAAAWMGHRRVRVIAITRTASIGNHARRLSPTRSAYRSAGRAPWPQVSATAREYGAFYVMLVRLLGNSICLFWRVTPRYAVRPRVDRWAGVTRFVQAFEAYAPALDPFSS